MARRYRYEYRQKKKARQKRKENRQLMKQLRLENMSDRERELREVLGWIVYILIVICATYLIVTYVGQRTKVSGDSMLDTLHDGDNLIVDKISYVVRDPKRYEVVVFKYRHAEDTYYIKRIIGLPGETVQIKDGSVYINGELLDEDYGREPMIDPGLAEDPIVLGEDEYFVLGDNRNHSSDSRESAVGVLDKDEFIGRAWVRIWPFDSIGVILHD